MKEAHSSKPHPKTKSVDFFITIPNSNYVQLYNDTSYNLFRFNDLGQNLEKSRAPPLDNPTCIVHQIKRYFRLETNCKNQQIMVTLGKIYH